MARLLYFLLFLLSVAINQPIIYDSVMQNKFQVFDNIQTEIEIFQKSIQNMTCYYVISNEDTGQFIHFELFISDSINIIDEELTSIPIVAFSSSIGNPPDLMEATQEIIAQFADQNCLELNKHYCHLVIPPDASKFSEGELIYINVFIPYISQYEYRLQIQRSLTKPCAQDCMGFENLQGKCLDGICDCSLDNVDEDCSVPAKRIIEYSKQNISQMITSAEKYYYYYEPGEIPDKAIQIKFKLELCSSPLQKLDFYLKREYRPSEDRDEVYLPTRRVNQQFFYLNLARNEISYSIQSGFLRNNPILNRTERLLISMNASEAEMVIFSVEIQKENSGEESSVNMMLIYFLVAIAVVLILTWIILTIIKLRYQRQNQIHDQQQSQNRRRRRGQPNNALKPETIDKYMPKMEFLLVYEQESFKSKQKERIQDESCAVCLIEFKNNDPCRSTPCLHVFHADCLEQWLKKNESCPVCRAELTEKEFQQKESQIQDQAQHQQGPGVTSNLQPEQERQ